MEAETNVRLGPPEPIGNRADREKEIDAGGTTVFEVE